MSPARFASMLDPLELEEFQETARTLLAHPLVTISYPNPEALPRVRRWETTLRNEFERLTRWRLEVAPTCARLVQRRVEPSPRRPAMVTVAGGERTPRPFGRLGYVLLCLVLAALHGEVGQTTIRRLVEGVMRVRAGDESIPIDFGRIEYRRAFVYAVGYLERLGVLRTAPDGETVAFIEDEQADALYTIDHDAARRMLGATPAWIDPQRGLEQFGEERYPPGAGDALLRHRLARRLLDESAVYYDELHADERDHLAERRARLIGDLERLTGCEVEMRAEGLALIDSAGQPRLNDQPFPGTGIVNNVALLFADALLANPAGQGQVAGRLPVGQRVPPEAVKTVWAGIVAEHRDRFTVAYEADPEALRVAVLALLERLGLTVPAGSEEPPGTVVLRPLAARFRPGSGDAPTRRRRASQRRR
jgi:uncharacterized protein (TIGR02678 family)